ncbi:MAG TPA: rhodanese-like domain-containing protein [Thermoanaerobaculia bacterium]|nr:rhodanese-like domain-containing protein [Thermoanaerobaculia bacterium]
MQDRLRDTAGFQFWNVLTDDYFKGQMIPGSRRVPLDVVVKTAKTEAIAEDAEIIVYCSGPGCPQSLLAAEKLTTVGFTNVRVYEEGLAGWVG